MNAKDYFKGKKVTLMGLGLLGRGIGDAKYVAEAGALEVIVTDLKSEEELTSSVQELKQFKNIKFVLGEHRKEDFLNQDLIIVAAGVPLDSPYLQTAREAGIRLVQSAALFAELSGVPIIGVTGTRGKSTVTHMIHHVLSFVTGEKVLLGGNIRGVSNLQLLKEVEDDSLCVMELDSWQLQGFGWAEMSPQVAVFTSFMEDHLNYYERGGKTKDEAMALYFKDKAQIFLHQEESGVLVITPTVFEWTKKILPEVTLGQEIILADSSSIPEDCLLSMPGEHNRLNAALAYEALKSVGLAEEEIFDGLATFPGVEGRMQLLTTTAGGVRVYNDNNATTPAATMVGIKAAAEGKNVVLIMGGADKGIEMQALLGTIEEHCKQIVLIPGTGTDRLLKTLQDNSTVKGTILDKVLVKNSLKEAVEAGLTYSESGDVLLFSPGFASFGMFKNEYERNDEFVKIIEALENDSNN